MDKLYDLYKKIREDTATVKDKQEFELLKTISCIDPRKMDEILLAKYLSEKGTE